MYLQSGSREGNVAALFPFSSLLSLGLHAIEQHCQRSEWISAPHLPQSRHAVADKS